MPYALAETEEEESVISDDYWDKAIIFEKENGNYLHFTGRVQLDAPLIVSDQGDHSDLTMRRLRFGLQGKFSDAVIRLEADLDLNGALRNAYTRITDANITWTFENDSKLRLFKQRAGFTMDGGTSTKKLLTPERNNLTNNLWFTNEYYTGITYAGLFSDDWAYFAGYYVNDGATGVGIEDSNYFTLFRLGRRNDTFRLWDEATFRVDHIRGNENNDPDSELRKFTEITSLIANINKDKWELHTDIAYGDGYEEQGDVWGLVVMPAYQQTEIVQWVGRVTYVESNRPESVRLNRYDNRVFSGLGDVYTEVFGGVNFYLNKHKFKIQVGAHLSELNGGESEYDGFGLTAALRVYW
ncbi:porin [Biformimicrobium ophioploci]|uniref:Porin n=1 Tax=Biformimicrobium ophioploci TaxID=3036711 RepID=A0ABQ6LXQ9_9GAMM|nr:porin [Microbulbifer sp. NKW57]GMG86843.1 hypothetical protein MNKW57_11640 [Microbulbifer sp. NKW57]